MKIEECVNCFGTGIVAHPNAGEEHPCFHCGGYKYLNRDGYQFRSEKGVNMAKTKFRCRSCNATGIQTWEMTTTCPESGCEGGKILREFLPGETYPSKELKNRCHWPTQPAWEKFVNHCNIMVMKEDRAQTWYESYLGPLQGQNGFYSCTDYGTAWDHGMTAQEAKFNIAAHREQWIKVLDENMVALPTIAVIINRGGYSVFATTLNGESKVPIWDYLEASVNA